MWLCKYTLIYDIILYLYFTYFNTENAKIIIIIIIYCEVYKLSIFPLYLYIIYKAALHLEVGDALKLLIEPRLWIYVLVNFT